MGLDEVLLTRASIKTLLSVPLAMTSNAMQEYARQAKASWNAHFIGKLT